MIKEIKIAKLRKINNEIQKYKPINEQKKNLTSQIKELEEKINQNKGLILYKKFNWFQKHITQRKEYKNYNNCEKNIKNMEKQKEELIEESKKLDLQLEKQYELKHEYEQIKDAKTLEDIDMNFENSIEFLKENDMPIILTKEDQYIDNEENKRKDYKSLEDFMLVHKTKYPPEQSKIKSAKEAKSMYNLEVMINNQNYTYQYQQERNTVHFAVNHEVISHEDGQWDDTKYAILIPFEDIQKEQIGCAEPVDTFTVGGVKLTPNSWILCPKGEKDKIENSNPGVQIMEYDGENVKGYPNVLLHNLGYQIENGGKWKWYEEKSQEQFEEIIKKENIKRGHHSFTEYSKNEQIIENANIVVSVFEIIKDNKLVNNDEEKERFPDVLQKCTLVAIEESMSKKIENNEKIEER